MSETSGLVQCQACLGTKRHMVAAAHTALRDRGVHVTHSVAVAVIDAVVAAAITHRDDE